MGNSYALLSLSSQASGGDSGRRVSWSWKARQMRSTSLHPALKPPTPNSCGRFRLWQVSSEQGQMCVWSRPLSSGGNLAPQGRGTAADVTLPYTRPALGTAACIWDSARILVFRRFRFPGAERARPSSLGCGYSPAGGWQIPRKKRQGRLAASAQLGGLPHLWKPVHLVLVPLSSPTRLLTTPATCQFFSSWSSGSM